MNNWKEFNLNDLAFYFNGKAFKPSDWRKEGVKIIRIEQLNNPTGTYDFYQGEFPEINRIVNGDLIFSWSATLKVLIWQWGDAVLNQHLFKVVPKQIVGKYFLFFLLDYNMPKLGETSHGSTMKHIRRTELEKYTVQIPNITEQFKIAKILSSTDAIIEKTQAAIAKYKAIKQGMLHDLFTRGIDVKTGKLRPRYEDAPELYKEGKLGWVPKEWEVDVLEKICDINPSLNIPKDLKNNDEVTFLKMEDVSNEAQVVNTNSRKIIEVLKKGFTAFCENDILFAKITPCMENGKGALARDLKNGIGFGSTEFHVLRAKDKKSILFIFYLSTSDEFRLRAEGKMSGSAGQQRVPTNFFNEYEIATPILDEQLEIGLRIDIINSKIKTEEKFLFKQQEIKSGLMGDLLSGRKIVKN